MKSAGKKRKPTRRRPLIEEVEPRILYSADVSPLATPPLPAEHRTLDPLPVVGRDEETDELDWQSENDRVAYADELAISMGLEGPRHTAPMGA
jgi:hypothetical protein